VSGDGQSEDRRSTVETFLEWAQGRDVDPEAVLGVLGSARMEYLTTLMDGAARDAEGKRLAAERKPESAQLQRIAAELLSLHEPRENAAGSWRTGPKTAAAAEALLLAIRDEYPDVGAAKGLPGAPLIARESQGNPAAPIAARAAAALRKFGVSEEWVTGLLFAAALRPLRSK
jgi:hypothetical protein